MHNHMVRRYGLPTAICMVVGIVIGSGIFFKTESVLKVTDGNVFSGVLSLIVIGIIMFFCAYAFSLLAQRYEKVNGVVDYAEAICGEKYAYYLGWFMTFVYTPAITSVLAWVSAMYFGALFGFAPTSGEVLVMAGFFLTAATFLSAVSPKIAGKAQVSTTVIKMIPLIMMAVVGIIAGLSNGQLASNFMLSFQNGSTATHGLTASVVSLAFAFEGWILVTTINAELKDARKNLPLALIIGLIIIVSVYVLYYLGICGAISVDELIAAGSPQAFKKIFGGFFGTLLSVFIAISCMGTTNGLIMANSRSIYSLAVRGHGPRPTLFAKIDESTGMPMNSAFAGLLLAFAWLLYYYGANLSTNWFGIFSFDSSELVIVAMYVFYIPIFIKMFKIQDLSPFNRIVVPALAIVSSLILIGCAIYSHGIVKYRAAAANGEFAFPVLFFAIVASLILFIGRFFYRGNQK